MASSYFPLLPSVIFFQRRYKLEKWKRETKIERDYGFFPQIFRGKTFIINLISLRRKDFFFFQQQMNFFPEHSLRHRQWNRNLKKYFLMSGPGQHQISSCGHGCRSIIEACVPSVLSSAIRECYILSLFFFTLPSYFWEALSSFHSSSSPS